MICYKCGQEMFPVYDTAWRNHHDGTRSRTTEFLCSGCRVWALIKTDDFSQCALLNEMLDKVEEYAREDKE